MSRGRAARTSGAVCQAEIHPLQVGGKFLRPTLGGSELRQLLRYGATTPPGPAGDFHLLQGALGITQGKWPGTRAADSPHSLTGKRKAPLSVPETLDYPHRADQAHSLALTHTRAGTGRTPQQSARGGKGAPPPPAPPRAPGRRETPPPVTRLLSPPLFPPGLMDEPRALLEPAFPFGPRREGE